MASYCCVEGTLKRGLMAIDGFRNRNITPQQYLLYLSFFASYEKKSKVTKLEDKVISLCVCV